MTSTLFMKLTLEPTRLRIHIIIKIFLKKTTLMGSLQNN